MKRTKRLLAWVLTLVLLTGMLPNMGSWLPAAKAADDEDATVDAFGIKMEDWTDEQAAAAEKNSPFGGGLNSATSVMTFAELYVSAGRDSNARATKTFDWTGANVEQKVWDFIGDGNNSSLTYQSSSYKFVETAPMDMKGTGKDEYVVNYAFTGGGTNSRLDLFVTDSNGNRVTNSVLVASGAGIDQVDKLNTYQLRGAISVVAGDFDGTGKDSILVYVPALGQNPCIWRYTVDGSTLQRDGSLGPKENVLDLLGVSLPENADRDNPHNQPMVHMLAEDVDRDGYDELILTAGMNDVVGSGDTGKTGNLGSQLFIFDRVNGTWQQSYQLDLNTTSGGGAHEANRLVWASSTVGNIMTPDSDSSVDYPEIIAAGYQDPASNGAWNIDIPSDDWLGAVVVGVDSMKSGKAGENMVANYSVRFQEQLTPNGFTKTGFYEGDDCNNVLPVQAFADRGLSYNESVFISGSVFRVNENKDGFDQVYTPSHFDDAPRSVNGTEVTNAHIQAVTAGNFDGNREGGEQILCATSLRQSGKNNSWSDLVFIQNKGNASEFSFSESGDGPLGFQKRDRFYITLHALDVDDDSLVLTLTEVKREYSKPDVMAILEAPPYFAEINGGDTGNSATTYGTATSSGSGSEDSTGFSAGITVGYEVDGLFFGGGAETSIDTSFTSSTASSQSIEWGIEYSNDSGDNLIVVYRCPVACYHYKDQNGETLAIFRSEQPATSMIPVSEYNAIAPGYGLEVVSDDLLGEPGNPFSYRSDSTSLNGVVNGQANTQTSPNGWVQYYGQGTVTQSLETGKETEETFEYGLDVSVSVWGKAGGAKAGVQAGYSESHSQTTVNGSTVTKSGAVTSQQVEGYDFQWKFIAFQHKINDNTIPVLGYLVTNVVAPPSPPVDLSVDNVTSDSLTLSWEHGDRTAQQYRIYRVLESSSMPYMQVDSVSGNVDSYTVTGLNPGTTYTYVVRAVGYDAAGAEQVSVDSSPVTARTTTDGADDVTVSLSTLTLSSTGETASITANVYNPRGNTFYTWQIRAPGSSRWVDLTNGEENQGIGTVSGAAAKTLVMNSIDGEMDGAALRCIVIAPTSDQTPEYYYSPIATLVLQGEDTTTTLSVSGQLDGSGTQATPYTGLPDYNAVTNTPSTAYEYLPVTVGDYTIYEYKKDNSTVYVGVKSGLGGNSYAKATQSGSSYTIGDALTTGSEGYYYNNNGTKTAYTAPAGFDGTTLQTATVTTGEGDTAVTTTYYRSYLFSDGKPTTEYWYEQEAGKYYTRAEVQDQPGTYTYTELPTQPDDEADIRRVYKNDANSIIVDQSSDTDIYDGGANTPGYGYYKFETYTGANTAASAIFWYETDTGLYYETQGTSEPPQTIQVKYADSGSLSVVTALQEVSTTITKTEPTSGTQITLSSTVAKGEGASVGTTVDYIITHIPTGGKTSLSAASGSSVTWTANAPGLYEITATARSTVSTLSSSATCYYYAREVASDDQTTEYQLLVKRNGEIVSSATYSNGQAFTLTLQSRTAAGATGTPGSWTDVSNATYFLNNSSSPLSGASYTPTAAGSYSFAAKVDGKVVAMAALTITKANATLSPTWSESGIPETLSGITVTAEPEIQDIALTDAVQVSCELYGADGNLQSGKYGNFPVTLSWKTGAAATALQSRYNVVLSSGTLYRQADTVPVNFSGGENGTVTASRIEGNEYSITSGTSVSVTNDVKFTATPAAGFVVEKWTVNDAEQTEGIQSFANGGQTLTLDLSQYSDAVTVYVTFTNSQNQVTFSAGENGSVTAQDGSQNSITSGSQVAYGADLTFTAVPNEGYMVDYWTVNGMTFCWDTGENYRENVLVLEDISEGCTVIVNFVQKADTKVVIGDAVDASEQVTSAAAVEVKDLEGTVLQPEDGAYTVQQNSSLVLTAQIQGGSDNTRVTEWQSSTNGTDWTTIPGSGSQESITIHNFTGETLYVRVKVSTAQSYQLSWVVRMADGSQVPAEAAASLKAASNGLELTSGGYQTAFTSVDFTLTLDDAYYVVEWSDNVVPSGTTAILNSLTGDTAVAVTIAKKPVLTIVDETGGTVEVKGTVNGVADTVVQDGDYVDYGTAITVTLTPDKGYVVGSLGSISPSYIDGDGTTTDTMTYTVRRVTADGTVPQAWTALDEYPIGFSVVDTNDDGSGDFGTLAADVERKGMDDYATDEDVDADITGSTIVYEGGTVTFTADADAGYRVKEWTVDGKVYQTNGQTYTAAVLTLTPDAAKTVTVQFEAGAPQVFFDQPANGTLEAVTPTDDGGTEPFTSGGATVLPVTFTVTPDEHYEVKQWTVNGVVQADQDGTPITDTTFTLTPTGNVTVAAELWGEELNAQVIPGAGGTADISGIVRYDEELTITATPEAGYVVESISAAGEDNALYTNDTKANGEQSATYEIFEDTDFTVVFAKKPVVTFSAANGIISATGTVDGTPAATLTSGSYVDFGTSVTFTAQANTGFNFDGWYVDGVKDESAADLTYTLSDAAADATVEARFIATPDLAVTYSVSDDTMGTITATAGGRGFASGDLLSGGVEVVFTVQPVEGYRVASWTGLPADAVISADKATATVTALDQALTIQAVLEAIPQRTITITEPQHGTLTATAGGQPIVSGDTVPDGTEVTFTATADANWMFDQWTGDAAGQTVSTITLTVTDDIAVGADFAVATYYTIQYSVTGAGGSATGASGETDITYDTAVQLVGGSTVVITAAPDPGQMVKAWTVNGETVTKDNLETLGLSMHPLSKTLILDYLAENTVITVEFETYAGFTTPGNGVGYTVENVTRAPDDTEPAGEIRKGGDLTFTVKPEATYAITAVTVADENAEIKANPDGSWTVTILNVQDDIDLNVTTVAGIPLVVDCGANGTVTVKRNDVELPANTGLQAGDELVITAAAESGYRLKSLTINGVSFPNGGTYTVVGDEQAIAVKAEFDVQPSGGGGGSSVKTYDITVEQADNGLVTVDPESAASGKPVIITVTPNEGYVLESITVTDADGVSVDVSDKGDGTYEFQMPAAAVTVTAQFAVRTPVEDLFDDVDAGDWFHDSVEYVYYHGMMNGISSRLFAPYLNLNRGMIATVLWRLENSPENTSDVFLDVEDGIWYTEAVNWAADNGIVKGYGNDTFGPEDDITREQMATILHRYAQYKGYDVSVGEDTNILSYTDASDVSEWAIPAVQWACGSGLLKGKGGGLLDPTGTATRAEVAEVLTRFCENIAP